MCVIHFSGFFWDSEFKSGVLIFDFGKLKMEPFFLFGVLRFGSAILHLANLNIFNTDLNSVMQRNPRRQLKRIETSFIVSLFEFGIENLFSIEKKMLNYKVKKKSF